MGLSGSGISSSTSAVSLSVSVLGSSDLEAVESSSLDAEVEVVLLESEETKDSELSDDSFDV